MSAAFRRRTLFKYLGLAGITTPFLHTLTAAAQTTGPKRLIIVATPNGTILDDLLPASNGSFGRILSSLTPFRSKVQVASGLDVKSAQVTPIPRDHWPDNINMLTARQGRGEGITQNAGISIDQHIANAFQGSTQFKSIHLGVGATGSFNTRISFTGPGAPVAPQNNPWTAFQTLFAGVTPPSTTPDPSIERKYLERKSILDGAVSELRALRCELGTEERPKLDRHLDSLREIERSLTYTPAPVTQACRLPSLGSTYDLAARSNFPKLAQDQASILAAAVGCQLSRVFTLQYTWGSDNFPHPWSGVQEGHHDIAHGNVAGLTDAQRREKLTLIDEWYAQQFASLVSKLDSIPEDNGTALDNTACVWIHEQVDASSHARTKVPYVIAGSCGGVLKTGGHLTFPGQPHARMLTTLAQAVGVPTAQFGDPSFDSSPLSGLFR